MKGMVAILPSDVTVAPALREIAAILEPRGTIAVLPHNSTDGDTLGSCLAFCIAARKLGKDASLIYEEKIPDHLSDLTAYRDLFMFLPDDPGFYSRKWDAIAVFDTADPKLLGKREKLLGLSGCVVNIDHHFTNCAYGDHNYINAEASSTAEIAFGLITAMGAEMDHDIALAIYAGICTDTGGFGYANTTGACHEITAKILKYGIDVAYFRYKFFDEITLEKLRCHTLAASSLRLYDGGKIALVVVTAAALADIGASEEDCEGLVNIGRNISGVELSAFAREIRAGEFRINLRSRGAYDVAAIAGKFDGGGHKLAAGCTISASPDEIGQMLLDAIRPGTDP